MWFTAQLDSEINRDFGRYGTWQCDGHIYKYRLEISGRLSNAVKDSTYIYLSNIEDITFEQAWKASGLSSNMDDYFDIDEAVLVELPD